MHVYSKELNYGKYVHIALGVIAASVTYWFTKNTYDQIDLRALGTFSIILTCFEWFFNKHLWKLFVRLPFVKLVNLSGDWQGRITLGKGNQRSAPAKVSIKQDWAKIKILYESDGKGAESFSASFMHNRLDSGVFELVYNDYAKNLDTGESEFDTNGTALLKFYKKDLKLKGKYFTQKSKLGLGHMDLTKDDMPISKWYWAWSTVAISTILSFIILNIQ